MTAGTSVRVGVDLCAADDVACAVDRFGARYLERVFTAAEIAYCDAGDSHRAERLAARFAAKEATLKALRPDDDAFDWRAIEVVRRPAGWCEIHLSGPMADLARRQGIQSLELSLTHERGLAAAVVVATVEATDSTNPTDPSDPIDRTTPPEPGAPT